MKRVVFLTYVLITLLLLFASTIYADVSYGERYNSPVTASHLDMIASLFKDNGLKEALVGIDRYGRVELKGRYADSKEVSLAFSLAQSVVGVKWVSPVTPENIKVKEWEKAISNQLSSLFAKRKLQPQSRKDRATKGKGGTRYALVVGVGEFANRDKYKLKTGKELNLKYAEKDARDIYSYLVDPNGGNFTADNAYLLLNKDATRSNIQNTLNRIKEKATSDDTVLLYFSSHGTPSKYDGSMDIVTYDSDLKSSYTSWQTSFPAEYLKDFIFQTEAGTIIIILDVCFSGAAFKNINGFYYEGAKTIDFDDDTQGISKSVMAKSLLGAKDIVFEDDVLRNSDFANGEATKVLISASDAGELSWESDTLKSSFFTYYFVDGLKSYGSVKQAFDYARPKVTEGVRKEKTVEAKVGNNIIKQPAEQHPQVVANKKDWDITISNK